MCLSAIYLDLCAVWRSDPLVLMGVCWRSDTESFAEMIPLVLVKGSFRDSDLSSLCRHREWNMATADKANDGGWVGGGGGVILYTAEKQGCGIWDIFKMGEMWKQQPLKQSHLPIKPKGPQINLHFSLNIIQKLCTRIKKIKHIEEIKKKQMIPYIHAFLLVERAH